MKRFWDSAVGKVLTSVIVAALLALASFIAGATRQGAVQSEKIAVLEKRVDRTETTTGETHDAVIRLESRVEHIQADVARIVTGIDEIKRHQQRERADGGRP